MSTISSLNEHGGVDPGERVAPKVHPCATRGRERLNLKGMLALIRSDIAFRCAYEKKEMTLATTLRLLLHPGISSVVRFRLQCFLMSNGLAPLGLLLKWYNVIVYRVLLDERARIAGGFCLVHPTYVSIVGDVEIGERCIFFHQNIVTSYSFCEPGAEAGPTIIGADVSFGIGCCVYGNVVVGDGCRIGPNAVVDRSFPAGSLLFGVPARAIGKNKASPTAPSA